MDNIMAWNVRGLNNRNKQNEVRRFIESHNIKLFSLLETRVKMKNLGSTYMNVCSGWCFPHNLKCHENGRIMIGWCPNAFTVDIKIVNSQFVHCWVQPKTGAIGFECTFVYGFNDQQSRSELWSGLKQINRRMVGAWLILGDFNAVSHTDDRIGSSVRRAELTPMLECILLSVRSVM